MSRLNHQSLRFAWAREIKQLAASGETDKLGELVDHIQTHVDEIGVFDRRWNGVITGARSRGLEVEIGKAYALALFRKQEGRCALSGLPIGFGRKGDWAPGRKVQGTASLDRINSALGYVAGNVWWLHRDVNKMKMDLPSALFVEMCCRVAETTRGGAAIPEPPDAPSAPDANDTPSRVARFVAECCEAEPGAATRVNDLWLAFEEWRAARSLPPTGHKWFGLALSGLGFARHKSSVVYYHGLRLKPREGCEGFPDPRMTLAPEISEQLE